MGQTEWAMWANEQGVITSSILIMGGILGVAGNFRRWEIGAYAIVLGVLVLLVEYPRGKRQHGKKTLERRYQGVLTPVVKCFGVVGRNYYVRFVFYLLACIPCGFFLPTILGGFSLFFASVIYLRAAVSGEQWNPVDQMAPGKTSTHDQTQPPTVPPPRNPRSQSIENLAYSGSSLNKI